MMACASSKNSPGASDVASMVSRASPPCGSAFVRTVIRTGSSTQQDVVFAAIAHSALEPSMLHCHAGASIFSMVPLIDARWRKNFVPANTAGELLRRASSVTVSPGSTREITGVIQTNHEMRCSVVYEVEAVLLPGFGSDVLDVAVDMIVNVPTATGNGPVTWIE